MNDDPKGSKPEPSPDGEGSKKEAASDSQAPIEAPAAKGSETPESADDKAPDEPAPPAFKETLFGETQTERAPSGAQKTSAQQDAGLKARAPGSLFGETTSREIAPRASTAPSLFGEIEPPAPIARTQWARGRAAQRLLDLHLRGVKRVKRFGLPLMIASVLFAALVVVPVMWVAMYRFFDPPGTVLMLERAADGERLRHSPVPISEMSPHIVRSVIAAEDANFCAHDGFDFEAIQDAMEHNRNGRRLRGASTISQQAAKNLFLWPSRSWLRKAFESYFTVLIETFWPKRRIMEAYLNAAEFGDGIFGVEAAAQERFGVSAARLTPLQAARLAAVLPSPNRYSAVRPGPYVRRQSATIMARARSVRASGAAACVLGSERR